MTAEEPQTVPALPADPDESAYERDPGLAAERTELAWNRSTLALFACGAAMLKGLPKVTGKPGRPLAGLLIFAFSGLI